MRSTEKVTFGKRPFDIGEGPSEKEEERKKERKKTRKKGHSVTIHRQRQL